MANPNKLRITYRPAKKEISFGIFENEREIEKKDYESLSKYEKERGTFVLSNYGSDFLKEILKPFSGKDYVNISVRTTRQDYEDFKQMVKEYNDNRSRNDSEIKLLPLEKNDELLDMKTSFTEIKREGEKFVNLLNEHISTIGNITAKNKDYFENRADKLKIEKDKIEKSLKDLSQNNNVNICLVGSYSSGKSTLINTLLGYKILPVDIREATAKMMVINGVSTRNESSIVFTMTENDEKKTCVVLWNGKQLYVNHSDFNSSFKNEIEDKIKESCSKRFDEQFYNLLDYINSKTVFNARVDLKFPIPLDSESLHFTIYDTPGTDGNHGAYKQVLNDALYGQTNSVLIFVLQPDSMAGSGNKELMKELLEKSEDANNMIDVEQSFFVINKADSADVELDKLKNSDLCKYENDNNPIRLANKKVFFVSSKYGFAAISQKNGVASPIDEKRLKFDKEKLCDEELGRYYQHNHYGKSEYATKSLIDNTNEELKNADKHKDELQKLYICSGVYSLKCGIEDFGERYASAVKTTAVIKSIEGAIKTVKKLVEQEQLENDKEVKDFKEKLEAEEKKINDIIYMTKTKYVDMSKFKSTKEKLGIDSTAFNNNVKEPVRESLKKNLKQFLIIGNVHLKEDMKNIVFADVDEIYTKYMKIYEGRRQPYLENSQERFISDIFSEIEEEESISEETKKDLKKTFKSPELPPFGLEKKIEELFDAAKLFKHENIKGFFKAISDYAGKVPVTGGVKTVKDGIDKVREKIEPWETKTINKKIFITEVLDSLEKNEAVIIEKLEKDFESSMQDMCNAVSKEFNDNMEVYSSRYRACKEDSKPLEKLKEILYTLQEEITERKTELDSKI